MLAASEAEAQKKPSQREVQEAIEGDLRKKFDGLIASEAACTKDTDDTATTNIATLAGTVDTKQNEVDRLSQELAEKSSRCEALELELAGLKQVFEEAGLGHPDSDMPSGWERCKSLQKRALVAASSHCWV